MVSINVKLPPNQSIEGWLYECQMQSDTKLQTVFRSACIKYINVCTQL